ncbi:hypothetical protein HD554DRAFT_2169681 [Boletus coccyginus]|nr:hypothetical protein HD554DRAFT_2169681 [Boletus coccyginus]
MARKSIQSPSKGASSQSHSSSVQVSWSEADTNILIGLVATHRASAVTPAKGHPRPARACKDKWKRLRKTYEVVSLICGTSGFAYTLDGGAGIGAENEDVWNEFMKKYKDAGPFRNKGWPHYEAMKNLMPSKGNSYNVFEIVYFSGVPSTDGVVDTAESGGDADLNSHCILGRDDKDSEATLEHTNDALDNVVELGVAEVVALIRIHRTTS